MRTWAILLLLTGVGSTLPRDAAAAGCVLKRSGGVVVRSECRRRERPLPAALGPAGPTGPNGPAGDPAGFPLVLVDAADRSLGPVLSFERHRAVVSVTNPALPGAVPFAVGPMGFTNYVEEDAAVYYAEPGCTGTPYVGAVAFKDGARVQGTAAYAPTGERQDVTVRAVEVDVTQLPTCAPTEVTARGTCCKPTTFTLTLSVRSAIRVTLEQLGFTPPFRALPRGGDSQ